MKLIILQLAEPPGTYYQIGQLLREQPNLLVTSNEQGVQRVLDNNMAFIKAILSVFKK